MVLGWLVAAGCSRWQEHSAVEKLKPCRYTDGPTDGYCGTLEVWENREAKTGRKIPLKIVLLPAMKQAAAEDPLFFLAGGPGQGATELAGDLRDAYRRIVAERDVVFVDQRGTGKSNPLECKADKAEKDTEDDDGAKSLRERLPKCLESYRDKADVTKYTTPVAMDDLDEVRQYLGYSKINLYGGSYGTRAAIVYARRHREATRAVILDGVAPPDMRLPLYMARDGERALGLLLEDCAKDKGCAGRYPNLRERLSGMLDRLEAHPQKIKFVHPRTGLEDEIEMTRRTVTNLLFAALYSPTVSALVPLLIDEAVKGNYTGLLALGGVGDAMSSGMAVGMHFSVICSEDVVRIEPGAMERESAGTLFRGMADWRLKPCAYWPKAPMEDTYYQNAGSDVPALILSGELDPVTPPSWGEQVASVWKNARHVVVPGTGHGAWGSGCVMKLMAQFLHDGSAAGLDTECVKKQKRPPFFLGPSGPEMKGGGQ